MGHYHTQVIGRGENLEDAKDDALAEFLYHNGTRHEFRGWEGAELIAMSPPKVLVREKKRGYVLCSMKYDFTAPKERWLEMWQLILHTHA